MSAIGSIGREALRGEGELEDIGIRVGGILVGADLALVSQRKVSGASPKKERREKHSARKARRLEQNGHGGEKQANRHTLRSVYVVVRASPPPNKTSFGNIDPSAGRGIGDFAEDGRTACAGGRRQICRALVNRFISEESEGEGFFRVHGHAEARGSKDGHE